MATEDTPKSRRDTKNKGFKCNICFEIFASKRTLNYHHQKGHSSTNLICDICGVLLPSDMILTVHKQIHFWEIEEIEEKYFNPMHECSVCDFKTRSPGSLVLHGFQVHPSLELFTSPEKPLKSKLMYDENENKIPTKHEEKDNELGPQVKCPLCDVSYGESRIKGHLMTAHPLYKRFFCSNCAAIIPDEEKMRAHQFEHSHGNNLYNCEYCEWLFISAEDLATHSRLHTSQSPYSCSVCQKEYQSKTPAVAHFYSHLKIDMLRETVMPQEADTGFSMPQNDTDDTTLTADKAGMITPIKE